jgi:hypothetical protein
VPNGKKGVYEVGFGKPPQATRFRLGRSGNPNGRPRGAKNFATAIEDELQARIPVTENGERKQISKLQVIAKHLVNKAAGGDLKAIPLLLNETRLREDDRADGAPGQIFDTPEDQKVIDSPSSAGFVSRVRHRRRTHRHHRRQERPSPRRCRNLRSQSNDPIGGRV